jgi:hypothetical protein
MALAKSGARHGVTTGHRSDLKVPGIMNLCRLDIAGDDSDPHRRSLGLIGAGETLLFGGMLAVRHVVLPISSILMLTLLVKGRH